jgi:hypothetical protein
MSPVWTTFLTSLISTLAVPYLEKKYGTQLPKMDATEQAALTAGAVGALTASAHWLHVKLFPHKKHR